MKRGIQIIIIAMLYIIFGFLMTGIFLPQNELLTNSVGVDEDHHAYIVEEGLLDIWVLQTASDAEVREVYRCRKRQAQVKAECKYDNGQLYLEQVWYEKDMQHFAVYRKSPSDKAFQKVWEKEIEEDINLTDFCVEEGVIRVVGIQQAKEAVLYEYKEGETEVINRIALKAVLPVRGCWGNQAVYILTADNRSIYIPIENSQITIYTAEAVSFLQTAAKGVFFQERDTGELYYRNYQNNISYCYEGIGEALAIETAVNGSKAVILTQKEKGKNLVFLSLDGTQRQLISSWKPRLMLLLKELAIPILLYTLGFGMVLTLLLIGISLLAAEKKLLHQIISVLAAVSLVWILMTTGIFFLYEKLHNIDNQMFYAKICANIQRSRLSEEFLAEKIDAEQLVEKGQSAMIKQVFYDDTANDTWQELLISTELVYSKEKAFFLFSKEAAYGRRLGSVYPDKTVQNIICYTGTYEGEVFLDKFEGTLHAVVIQPCLLDTLDTDENIYIVVRMPLLLLNSQEKEMVYYVGRIALAGWCIVMLILFLFLRKKWQPAALVVNQMEKVSCKDYRLPHKKMPDNEFGMIWSSMESMCKMLQLQQYKNQKELDDIYRFVPKRFEALFDKEDIREIEIGEMVCIPATIGIISVADKKTLLEEKLQKQYIQYVNQLLKILFWQKGKEQGVLLQNSSNLESVKIIFKGKENSALQGVRYGVLCMEAFMAQAEEKYRINSFVLLHTADYLFGLAGGGEQAYPFVASMELGILGSYIDDFKRNGVRMVITGETKQLLPASVQIRYIGYLSSQDEKYKFHIYEVLDTCPQVQKEAKRKTKKQFQKALELFYQNNFYLARSAFLDILKECPKDGIARWYVFTCEELLNREDNRNYRYDLFYR